MSEGVAFVDAEHDEGAFFRTKMVIVSVHRRSVPDQISGVALGSGDRQGKFWISICRDNLCVDFNEDGGYYFVPELQAISLDDVLVTSVEISAYLDSKNTNFRDDISRYKSEVRYKKSNMSCIDDELELVLGLIVKKHGDSKEKITTNDFIGVIGDLMHEERSIFVRYKDGVFTYRCACKNGNEFEKSINFDSVRKKCNNIIANYYGGVREPKEIINPWLALILHN